MRKVRCPLGRFMKNEWIQALELPFANGRPNLPECWDKLLRIFLHQAVRPSPVGCPIGQFQSTFSWN